MIEQLFAIIFKMSDIWVSFYPTLLVSGLLFGTIFILFMSFVNLKSAFVQKYIYFIALLKLAVPAFIAVQLLPAPRGQTSYIASATGQVVSRTIGFSEIVFLLWLGAVVSIGAYIVYKSVKLRTMIGRLKKTDIPKVYIGNSGPLVLGFFSPKIVVPTKFFRLSYEEQKAVIEHEKAHIRGGDQIIGLISHMIMVFFFVNPYVFMFYKRIREAAEMSADDSARIRTGISGRSYVGNLLDLSEVFAMSSVSGISAFSRTHGNLKERIVYQLTKENKMKKNWLKIALVLAFTVLIVTLFSIEPTEKEVTVDVEIVDGKAILTIDDNGEISEQIIDIDESLKSDDGDNIVVVKKVGVDSDIEIKGDTKVHSTCKIIVIDEDGKRTETEFDDIQALDGEIEALLGEKANIKIEMDKARDDIEVITTKDCVVIQDGKKTNISSKERKELEKTLTPIFDELSGIEISIDETIEDLISNIETTIDGEKIQIKTIQVGGEDNSSASVFYFTDDDNFIMKEGDKKTITVKTQVNDDDGEETVIYISGEEGDIKIDTDANGETIIKAHKVELVIDGDGKIIKKAITKDAK